MWETRKIGESGGDVKAAGEARAGEAPAGEVLAGPPVRARAD